MKLPKILKSLGYPALFLAVYLGINAYRQPTMPNAPQLSYHTQSGRRVDVIAQSHQTPVLVYFWGSWCHVCKYTSPNVQCLHQDGQAVLSVAVSSGDDGELGQYLTKNHYHFSTINDNHRTLSNQWQVGVTPSFVILKNGKVVQGFTGFTPLWLLKFRLWLAQ